MWEGELAIAYLRQLFLSLVLSCSCQVGHGASIQSEYITSECSLIPIRFLDHSTYFFLAHTFRHETLDIRTTSLLLCLFIRKLPNLSVPGMDADDTETLLRSRDENDGAASGRESDR